MFRFSGSLLWFRAVFVHSLLGSVPIWFGPVTPTPHRLASQSPKDQVHAHMIGGGGDPRRKIPSLESIKSLGLCPHYLGLGHRQNAPSSTTEAGAIGAAATCRSPCYSFSNYFEIPICLLISQNEILRNGISATLWRLMK